jgi:hypothetical protein
MTKTSCGACDGELDNNLVQPARRNFLLGVGTAVAAGLAPTVVDAHNSAISVNRSRKVAMVYFRARTLISNTATRDLDSSERLPDMDCARGL